MNYELVKVCGMRDAENIRAVEALGVDWMGFIFWPGSRRYVAERPSYLPVKAKRVGVFVDADMAEVMQKVEEYALDIIQLHGTESPEYVAQLADLIGHPSPLNSHFSPHASRLSLIKAFNIATAEDLKQTKAYEGLADYFLFDTKCKMPGGSGQQFDWSILSAYDAPVPYLLSGGIGPDDAERIKAFANPQSSILNPQSKNPQSSILNSQSKNPQSSILNPQSKNPQSSILNSQSKNPQSTPCIGIDLNSRFESEPGMKDVAALRRFLSQISHTPHSTHQPHQDNEQN